MKYSIDKRMDEALIQAEKAKPWLSSLVLILAVGLTLNLRAESLLEEDKRTIKAFHRHINIMKGQASYKQNKNTRCKKGSRSTTIDWTFCVTKVRG